jgi:hypothetical protein
MWTLCFSANVSPETFEAKILPVLKKRELHTLFEVPAKILPGANHLLKSA